MNHSKKLSIIYLCPWLGPVCVLLSGGSTRLLAQSSLSTFETVAVANTQISNNDYSLSNNSTNDGSASSASATQSFTGLDRNGDMQTMTFSGAVSTSATYGQLHSVASGTVSNTYFNTANPAYYDATTETINPAGTPNIVASAGFPSFTDTLQYGGALQSGYQARYIFHVDGSNSGYGALANLSVSIAGNNAVFYTYGDTGPVGADFATADYPINGQSPQSIKVTLSSQFNLLLSNVPDGSNLTGESNFSDTATLMGIEIVDANGNPVSGVTITSASGTAYGVVPEPGTLALILPAAAGLLVYLRRRERESGGKGSKG